MYLFFVGLTLKRRLVKSEIELLEAPLEYGEENGIYFIYHKGKIIKTKSTSLSETEIQGIRLNDHEYNHLVGQLKRVSAQAIYDAYNDNMAVQKIHCHPKRQIPFKLRARISE